MSNISATTVNYYIQHYLNKSSDDSQECLEKLSSGSNFTSTGSDPINLSKSLILEIEINANSQFQSNIELGGDLLATTEGYQENIISMVDRIRNLTLQAANETFTAEDKDAIISEIQDQLEYINYISSSVNFNGKNLLDGSQTDLTLQIGSSDSENVNVGSALIDVSTDALDITLDPSTTGENWTAEEIAEYLDNLEEAITTITNNLGQVGAYESRLNYASDKLTNLTNNLTEYHSDIADTDVAAVSTEYVQAQIIQQVSANIFTQANKVNQMKYSLLNSL